MAIHNFPINTYSIKLGDRMTASFGGVTILARAIVSCVAADGKRVIGYFLADDSPVPAATTTVNGTWGPIFLPASLLPAWVDMLRNETPLYGCINTDRPEWTSVSTSQEPVGEEEG